MLLWSACPWKDGDVCGASWSVWRVCLERLEFEGVVQPVHEPPGPNFYITLRHKIEGVVQPVPERRGAWTQLLHSHYMIRFLKRSS